MTDEVLATIAPSAARRGLAVFFLGALGVTLIYLGFVGEGVGFVLKILFLALGAGALALADRVWRATGVSLLLTEDALVDSTGRILCRTEDIEAIERSAFAFKPSNGFAVKLKRKTEPAYVPGLWWRYGQRLGVGGTVAKQEAKLMADIMALRLKMPDIQAALDE